MAARNGRQQWRVLSRERDKLKSSLQHTHTIFFFFFKKRQNFLRAPERRDRELRRLARRGRATRRATACRQLRQTRARECAALFQTAKRIDKKKPRVNFGQLSELEFRGRREDSDIFEPEQRRRLRLRTLDDTRARQTCNESETSDQRKLNFD